MKALKLTSKQARATRPDGHIWVDASAGTGKTHVLSARVLRLMLTDASPSSILCLTYTKAAAGEMVNRILERLGAWAIADEATLKGDLASLLGGPREVTADIIARARQLFLDVLDLPTGLNVDTLHAFSGSLLGRFPLEASTPPGFETMDDKTARQLLVSARDTLFAQSLEGGLLAKNTDALARNLADMTFMDVMSRLSDMAPVLLQLPTETRALKAVVYGALGLELDISSDTLMRSAVKRDAFDADALTALASAIDADGTAAEKGKVAAPIKAWLNAPEQECLRMFAQYQNAFCTKAEPPTMGRQYPSKPVKAAHGDAERIYQAEAQRLLRLHERLTLLGVAENTIRIAQFGQALAQQYGMEKSVAGKLDYSDLIRRTETLLSNSAVPPSWVLYRLDSEIQHILVDEAQDNSAVQWQIVEKLAQEFFDGHGVDGPPRTVFAVGDMKQSIYGFQGARPELFNDRRMAFESRAGQVQQPFEEVTLNQSFRSVPAVLDVVDAVFNLEHPALKDWRGSHESARAGAGGIVDLWPIQYDEKLETATDAPGWQLPLRERQERKGDRILAERIARDIAQRIKARESLPGRSSPLTAGDFLILVRQRGDFMGHMARALKQAQVPVAGVDRFDLNSPLVVRDMLNLARFASLPSDDYALACVLKGPFCGLDDEALLQLCPNRQGSVWQAVHDSAAVPEQVRTFLRGLLRRADYMPPYEFFSAALEGGGRTRLLERLGLDAEDALTVFLDQCLIYERDHTPSIDGFLHWFAQGNVEVKRDAEAASTMVRIMTIHGAKGLQAPVVYLPDLAKKPDEKPLFVELDYVHHGKRLNVPIFRQRKANDVGRVREAAEAANASAYAEYLRLVYVALTRAEDQLVCCSYGGAKPKPSRGSTEGSGERPHAYWLVQNALESLGAAVHPDVDGGLRYETVAAEPMSSPAAEEVDISLPAFLPQWADIPAPAEEAPPRPLQPSHDDAEVPAPFDVSSLFTRTQAPARAGSLSPAERGTLIHSLLEHLPDLPVAERDAAALRWLSSAAPSLDSASANALYREAVDTLALPGLAPLFGPEGRSEVPIIARLGNRIVSGQIDRVARDGKLLLFADYKSTQTPPSSKPEIAPAYLRQMALYGAALAKAWPDLEVKGALIWTVSGRVDWFERDELAAHLPADANAAFRAPRS